MGLVERLRRVADWVTWRRFIRLFVGGNAIVLSVLLVVGLGHPPDWLGITLGAIAVVTCVIGGVGMFAWSVRRVVIGRRRY